MLLPRRGDGRTRCKRAPPRLPRRRFLGWHHTADSGSEDHVHHHQALHGRAASLSVYWSATGAGLPTPHHPPGPQRSIQGAHRACRPGYGSLRRSGQLGCNRRSLHGCHHDRHSSRSTGHASRHPAAWTGPNITSATAELWKAYIAKHNLLRSRMELSLNVSAFPSVAEPPPAHGRQPQTEEGGDSNNDNGQCCGRLLGPRAAAGHNRCTGTGGEGPPPTRAAHNTRPTNGSVLHCTTVHSSSSLPTLTLNAEHRNSFPPLTGTPPLPDPTLPSAGSL